MKKLLVALTLSLAVFLPRAQAIPDSLPFLGSLRFEVNNQLTLASNNLTAAVAVTNKVEAAKQKKLITLLNTARKTIDRTKTNYVAGATVLGALNKSLGRSALSNEFNPVISNTFNVYLGSLINLEDLYSDRVDASYPGRAHDAAAKALDKFLLALNGASTNTNFIIRLKLVLAAAKGEALSLKATVKAEHAPAPPNGFTASINATGEGKFTYKPILQSVQGVYDNVLDRIIITSTEIKVSGGANNLLSQARSIYFTLINIPGSGTYTYNLTSPGLLAFYSSTRTRTTGALSGSPHTTVEFAEVYSVNDVDFGDINQGTLTITFDANTKLAYGSFSFSANGDEVASRTATVNGSFSITTLP